MHHRPLIALLLSAGLLAPQVFEPSVWQNIQTEKRSGGIFRQEALSCAEISSTKQPIFAHARLFSTRWLWPLQALSIVLLPHSPMVGQSVESLRPAPKITIQAKSSNHATLHDLKDIEHRLRVLTKETQRIARNLEREIADAVRERDAGRDGQAGAGEGLPTAIRIKAFVTLENAFFHPADAEMPKSRENTRPSPTWLEMVGNLQKLLHDMDVLIAEGQLIHARLQVLNVHDPQDLVYIDPSIRERAFDAYGDTLMRASSAVEDASFLVPGKMASHQAVSITSPSGQLTLAPTSSPNGTRNFQLSYSQTSPKGTQGSPVIQRTVTVTPEGYHVQVPAQESSGQKLRSFFSGVSPVFLALLTASLLLSFGAKAQSLPDSFIQAPAARVAYDYVKTPFYSAQLQSKMEADQAARHMAPVISVADMEFQQLTFKIRDFLSGFLMDQGKDMDILNHISIVPLKGNISGENLYPSDSEPYFSPEGEVVGTMIVINVRYWTDPKNRRYATEDIFRHYMVHELRHAMEMRERWERVSLITRLINRKVPELGERGRNSIAAALKYMDEPPADQYASSHLPPSKAVLTLTRRYAKLYTDGYNDEVYRFMTPQVREEFIRLKDKPLVELRQLEAESPEKNRPKEPKEGNSLAPLPEYFFLPTEPLFFFIEETVESMGPSRYLGKASSQGRTSLGAAA